MTSPKTKERLKRYLLLKLENDLELEQLARLRSVAAQKSDSKKAEERRIMSVINTNLQEMEIMQQAVESLDDPIMRMVLRMRYIEPDKENQRQKWEDIAIAIYGSASEIRMKTLYRVHGQALRSLQM